jgi:uncharacterized membrane protein
MSPQPGVPQPPQGDRVGAQQAADRLRVLRQELASDEVQAVLALTPEQHQRFDDWSRAKLTALAQQFDVDTSISQKRASWGMRIASTLGGLAICAAVVLFFVRYWGYLDTWAQLAITSLTPLAALGCTEIVARRERARYFTGLLALVALAGFIMNLSMAGSIFNMNSTERALLAWGAFGVALAYRYGLRLMLVLGMVLLIGYAAAAFTVQMGHPWLAFPERPEHFLLFGLAVFALPFFVKHPRNPDFLPVYRVLGALTFFFAILALAEWGGASYLAWDSANVERIYEVAGLVLSAAAIYAGITHDWNGIVNTGAAFFTVFLFTRLYHWWWNWMPRYLFFAVIGALGVGLVLVFKRVRGSMGQFDNEASA